MRRFILLDGSAFAILLRGEFCRARHQHMVFTVQKQNAFFTGLLEPRHDVDDERIVHGRDQSFDSVEINLKGAYAELVHHARNFTELLCAANHKVRHHIHAGVLRYILG